MNTYNVIIDAPNDNSTKSMRETGLALVDRANKVETINLLRSPAERLISVIRARSEALAEDDRLLAEIADNAEDYYELFNEGYGAF